MTRILVGLVASGLMFAGLAQADEKKPVFSAEKLIGTWQMTDGIKDGEKASEDGIKTTKLVITKDKLTLKTGIGDFVMKYSVDAKASPIALDLEITEGPDPSANGAKSKGIISLDGETVKISYHPMGGDRPKNFEAKKGSGEYSFTAKLVKEEKKDK
jgi:uncharacterized protein (TIGR03067 family)